MIRDITIGRYFDSESVIHRMDPRTKLMGAIVYIISLFLVKNPLWYLLCLAVILTLYKIAKVPFGYLLRGLKGIILLLLFTFLFRMLYTPGDVIGSFWIFSVTEQGIVKAIQMTARIALMIAGASLLSYTSTPKELADGLERAFSKTEKLGIPIHEMSVIVMIAFRFIPIMLDELNLLMDASDLAMAMEARGYTGSTETSRMYPLVYEQRDILAYVIIIIYFLLFLFWKIIMHVI